MEFRLELWIVVVLCRWCLFFVVFLVRMWCLKVWLCLMVLFGCIMKCFVVFFLVFILGMMNNFSLLDGDGCVVGLCFWFVFWNLVYLCMVICLCSCCYCWCVVLIGWCVELLLNLCVMCVGLLFFFFWWEYYDYLVFFYFWYLFDLVDFFEICV